MTTTDTTTRARELAQQLSELSEKATPGEWHMLGSDREGYEMALLRETEPKSGESDYQRIGVECVGPQGAANQDFIAFTRNNAAAIADTLTALSDENAKLRERMARVEAELENVAAQLVDAESKTHGLLQETVSINKLATFWREACERSDAVGRQLIAENAKLREALCSMVAEHCAWDEGGMMSTGALSANEDAINLLEAMGLVVQMVGHPRRYGWVKLEPTTPQ